MYNVLDGPICFPHGPRGVFISGGARIGKNVVIFQQVTIGSNMLLNTKRPGKPRIGSDVYIGAGAKIIGGVTVGDGCRVGANAVVYNDLPPHSVAIPARTRVIQKTDLDNRHFTLLNGKRCFFRDGEWMLDGSAEKRLSST